jgi:hypothetical protein
MHLRSQYPKKELIKDCSRDESRAEERSGGASAGGMHQICHLKDLVEIPLLMISSFWYQTIYHCFFVGE